MINMLRILTEKVNMPEQIVNVRKKCKSKNKKEMICIKTIITEMKNDFEKSH